MLRGRHAAVMLAALAGAWACSKDYTDATAPAPVDAGPTQDTGPTILQPANGPGITISKIVVLRGDHTSIDFVVNRAGHNLPLTVVANNVPPNVTIAPANVAQGDTIGTLDVTAGPSATEGTTTIELALLEGNDKVATAATPLEIGPFRAGTLDPTFGASGFVDLGLAPETSLLTFGTDGSLYVKATSGLTRWTKDGVRDMTYGPLDASDRLTVFTIAGTDSGQLYIAGSLQPMVGASSASAVVLRTTADGKTFDPDWGNAGAAFPPSTPSTGGFYNATGIGLTPTAIFTVVKLENDGTGSAGPTTLSRLTLKGAVDTTYGTNGYRTLPTVPSAPEGVLFQSIGENHFVLSTPDISSAKPFLYLQEGDGVALTLRIGTAGTPTALAYDPIGTYVARDVEGVTTVIRVGDAGIDPAFALNVKGAVHTITAENGRPIVTACANASANWARYFPDGGVDSTYRNDSTTELTCILAAQATAKYIYVVGPGGPLKQLRLARLTR